MIRPRRYTFSVCSPSHRLLIKLNENSINKSAPVWPGVRPSSAAAHPPLSLRVLPKTSHPSPPALADRPGLPCPGGSDAPASSPAAQRVPQNTTASAQPANGAEAVAMALAETAALAGDGGSGCKCGGKGCGGAPFTSLSTSRDRVHLHPRGGGTCSSRRLQQQPSTCSRLLRRRSAPAPPGEGRRRVAPPDSASCNTWIVSRPR